MNDDAKDEPVPWELIAPLVAWMARHNVTRLRVVATPAPVPVIAEPARDETVHLLYCEEAPASSGLLDVYVVADEDGGGRLNGPTEVPQAVIRPILRALDAASVDEFLIAAEEVGEASTAARQVSTAVATRHSDIEEHELPSGDNWPPPVVAVRVPTRRNDV